MAVKIAIANKKGGIGKTTTSLCLADTFKRMRYRVLLVDTDSQMNATSVYGAKTEGEVTLADIVYAAEPASSAVQHLPMGDIIPADKVLETAESSIPSDVNRFYKIKDTFGSVEDDYDIIIFDCPPGNGVILGNVLSYVDYVIIPIVCDKFSVNGLSDFGGIMSTYKARINPGLSVLGVLITKYNQRETLTRDLENHILPELAESLGGVLFDTKIRQSVKLREAQILEKTIYDYDMKGRVSEDYEDLGHEIVSILKKKGALDNGKK